MWPVNLYVLFSRHGAFPDVYYCTSMPPEMQVSELNADNKVHLQFMVEDTFMLLVHGLLLRLFLSSVIFIPAWSTFSEIQNNNYQEFLTVQLLPQKIKRQQKTKQDTVIQRSRGRATG